MTIQLIAFLGLVIGVALYALLVRRRVLVRGVGSSLARQLAQSNEVALRRLRDATMRRSVTGAAAADRDAAGVGVDRRSGVDRRGPEDRRRGRGRRRGGDRRRGWRP